MWTAGNCRPIHDSCGIYRAKLLQGWSLVLASSTQRISEALGGYGQPTMTFPFDAYSWGKRSFSLWWLFLGLWEVKQTMAGPFRIVSESSAIGGWYFVSSLKSTTATLRLEKRNVPCLRHVNERFGTRSHQTRIYPTTIASILWKWSHRLKDTAYLPNQRSCHGTLASMPRCIFVWCVYRRGSSSNKTRESVWC